MGGCQGQCFQGVFNGSYHGNGLPDVQAMLHRRHARLQKNLRSTIDQERVYGIEALGRLENHEALGYVEVAAKLLEDPSWSVRHAAAAFLPATPGAIAVVAPMLEKLLRGSDPSVQLLAAALLRPCLAELSLAEAAGTPRPAGSPCDSPCVVDERERLCLAVLADRRLALGAVQVAGESLKYVAEEFMGDREIVCTALHQCGQSLRHAPREFWEDRSAVLAAVAQDGMALRHAAEELQRDPEVVATATGQNESALGYAGGEFRDLALLREVLCENTMLLDQWSATERAVFGKGSIEPSTAYVAKRAQFIDLMRDLASSIQLPDCWMHALTLLDALNCTARTGDLVSNDLAVAAVMLVGRMMNGRLNYLDQGPMIALHLGRSFELKDPDLKILRCAEVHIFAALGGRLMLPSVASWTDAIFNRLTMLCGSELVVPLREATPLAQRMAEVLALRIPSSAKTPPSMLAIAACGASLVGVGILPMDELLWTGDSTAPASKAMAMCKKLEGAAAPTKGFSPDLFPAGMPRLDAATLAKVVGGDVATLRANVLTTLCAAA